MDELMTWEHALALCLGIGLSSAAGFRIFVPPLALGVAQRLGAPLTDVAPAWLGSWPAIIAFGIAALIEVGAYYVPWLDNLLDTIASPAAVIAGVLLTAGLLGEMEPTWQWSLAIIAGGSAAGVTQAGTVLTRAASTATTGGCGNFLVATFELFAAAGLAVIALLLAPAAVILFVGTVIWLAVVWRRRRRRATAGKAAQHAGAS